MYVLHYAFSKHTHVTPLKKTGVIFTPLPSHNNHLSTLTNFLCALGGYYGEVWLYLHKFKSSIKYDRDDTKKKLQSN